jgi:uncharacterized protein YcnI
MTASLHRPPTRRLAAALGVAAGVVALVAGPAGAHIHTDPEQVPAGSTATVGFEVEHGCEGSPTVEVSIEIPPGVNDASAEPIPGWSVSVESGVARWTGGSLPDDSPGVFPLRMTLPSQPGRLPFKMVQRCAVGSLDWIEDTVAGQPEPEHPAPILEVTAAEPASTTTAPPEPSTTQPPGDGAAPADDDSPLPYVLGGLAAVAVIGGGGFALYRSRQDGGS